MAHELNTAELDEVSGGSVYYTAVSNTAFLVTNPTTFQMDPRGTPIIPGSVFNCTRGPPGNVMNNAREELCFDQLDRVSGGGGFEDTMNDMSFLMQMRMEKHLDAYTQCIEMRGNVMIKVSNTGNQIVQNYK